ncbi:hypothetical protein D3C86_1680560 [compost metagenome]
MARVDQVFWPLRTYSSPSRVALLVIAAMSEPALGSDQPCAHMSVLAAMRGRNRCFCASVPNSIRVGPSSSWPF